MNGSYRLWGSCGTGDDSKFAILSSSLLRSEGGVVHGVAKTLAGRDLMETVGKIIDIQRQSAVFVASLYSP